MNMHRTNGTKDPADHRSVTLNTCQSVGVRHVIVLSHASRLRKERTKANLRLPPALIGE